MSGGDLQQMTMLELFRHEVETQAQVLNAGLLALEQHAGPGCTQEQMQEPLEACMRAAHSLKGAARIISLDAGVRVAHVMEDCFVLAQQGKLSLYRRQIDALFKGVDLLVRIANAPGDDESWGDHAGKPEIDAFLLALSSAMVADTATATDDREPDKVLATEVVAEKIAAPEPLAAASIAAAPSNVVAAVVPELRESSGAAGGRAVRVSADNLDHLLSLSGESLVESRRLKTFTASMLRLKRLQRETALALEALQNMPDVGAHASHAALAEVRILMAQSERMVGDHMAELDRFDRHSSNLSQRLYEQTLACRMRPFADGTGAYARMVRDVAHLLGKSARLEILGMATQIDRDILEKLDAPLGHLLRNALDHGIETQQQRRLAGKPEQGKITLEARHSAGVLLVSVSDDGAGVDLPRLRRTIAARKLVTPEVVNRLSEAELLEFLLLPGFSLRNEVTDISGRGVGLDVVADMLRQVRGTVRIYNNVGQGTRFQLQLPLTLSVMRSLLVSIADEPYAFPLAYVNRTLELRRDQIEVLEGKQYFDVDGQHVGLISAHQILQRGELRARGDVVMVVVIGDHEHTYGVAVDRFLDERMLVVQALDARLGKIPNIQAGALMEDGAPLLILDVADMLRSVEKLSATGQLENVQHGADAELGMAHKKVLVVDDSLTVRELERKLLSNRGYQVVVAVDGMDGWNAVRTETFDLVITDIDMPRMDGIELVSLIRQTAHLRTLPVMIVSYKDREEDRQRGLEAGADYYFAKSSFHDESLLQAVVDLIGVATT